MYVMTGVGKGIGESLFRLARFLQYKTIEDMLIFSLERRDNNAIFPIYRRAGDVKKSGA
ncbi:MAG: hypothetical protein JG781_323 [Peptococcaceae bacterium]|nr:hypothetical protein [Peptococcaceae bacterium]